MGNYYQKFKLVYLIKLHFCIIHFGKSTGKPNKRLGVSFFVDIIRHKSKIRAPPSYGH